MQISLELLFESFHRSHMQSIPYFSSCYLKHTVSFGFSLHQETTSRSANNSSIFCFSILVSSCILLLVDRSGTWCDLLLLVAHPLQGSTWHRQGIFAQKTATHQIFFLFFGPLSQNNPRDGCAGKSQQISSFCNAQTCPSGSHLSSPY